MPSALVSLRHSLSQLRRNLNVLGRRDDTAAVQRLFWLLHEPKHRGGEVRWRGRPLRYADGPALYCQLADIYVDRVYDFSSDRDAPRILDVGGHIGLASLRLLELHPRARLSVFEPDPALVTLLRANLVAAGVAPEVVSAAAWTSAGTQRFAATGDASGALDPQGALTVPTIDLAAYCREPVDFLKLDAEGAEYDLIAHLATTGALHNVRRLCLEMHEWTPAVPRFGRILETLAQAGFNYRVRSAGTLGAETSPAGFQAIAFPANLVVLHAWQP